MSDAVVVGGGLAGLVAARRLADSGIDVTVFERREEVGGRVRSVREDGFVFDRGFQVLFTGYPAVRRELDLDALDLRYFTAGATIARPGRRSTLADPRRSPGLLVDTLLNPEVGIADSLRLFRLQRELAGRDADGIFAGEDESIREYLLDRGFSRGFVESFAAPFYGGITLDRSLSTSSAVFEYTFRMLNEGKTAVPSTGMGAIPEQLAERARAAGATVETGTAVERIESGNGGGKGSETDGTVTVETGTETLTVDGAVVATDPRSAHELTGVDTPTASKGCVTQYYALPGNADLRTGKRLVLNAAGAEPNHVVPLSAVAPEYAPDGRTLVSAVFLGSGSHAGTGDAELAEDTAAALTDWYPERRFDAIELLRTERVDFAQFAQPPGFYRSLPDPDAPAGNVVLAGDYTRWSSIQGALESGRVAADTLGERLP